MNGTVAQLEPASDEDLVALARAGDSASFEELIRRHAPRIYGLSLSMMRNPQDAQDAMQDAFLNAYRRLDSFRGDAAFGSWFYRVATNACLMRLRARRRRPEVSLRMDDSSGQDDPWERPLRDPRPQVDTLYEQRELGGLIRQGVAALPDTYRAVFVLSDIEHYSMREIGEALDLTVPNVKTRLHRARLKLRAHLADYLPGRSTAPDSDEN